MDLQAERKVRGAIRASFSTTSKKIEDLLEEGKDTSQIHTLMDVLDLRYEKLDEKNSSILKLLAEDENTTQEDLNNEQVKIDEYDVVYFRTKLAVSKHNEPQNPTNNSSVQESEQTGNLNCKYKLPQLKIKEFDGEIKNWLPFWSQFKKIHGDPDLNPSDKFQYLIMAMKNDSVAKQVVDSYPVTGELYPDVINALKERFGRDDLLTEYYIRELLKMIIQNTNSSNRLPIGILYDNLQCHLRNLNSLGVTSENYAAILLPLVSSCLPEEMLKIWERESVPSLKRKKVDASHNDLLDDLIQFLRIEVEGEQKIVLARSGFVIDNQSSSQGVGRKRENNKSSVATASGLLTISKKGKAGECVFCSYSHRSSDCKKALGMTLIERRNIIKEKRACFCCLRQNHSAKNCKSRPKCVVCSKSHYVLMCDSVSPRENIEDGSGTRKSVDQEQYNSNSPKQDEVLTSLNKCGVLMQSLMVVVRGNGCNREARILIDSASQRSYITASLASEMNYMSKGEEAIQHSLFGCNTTGIIKHDSFSVYLSSLDGKYNCNFSALSQNKICGTIPSAAQGPWISELANAGIKLSDINSSRPIDILIGADIAGKLFTGNKKQLSSGLVAFETKLGWTLMGKVPSDTQQQTLAMVVVDMLTKETSLSDLWTLDTLGITDPSERNSRAQTDAATQQHFINTVSVTNEGRFLVHLPWVSNHSILPSNYNLALKRLQSTIKRLKREGLCDAYQKVFDDWEAEGIIQRVPNQGGVAPSHYLPHRHVLKPGSTTPIRPVFDASAHESKQPSLNQCLEKGPNLIEKIPSVLSRFRKRKIGVVGDIRKAFLQISVYEHDRNFLRFLWLNENGELVIYRHCRVVFGVSASPFLLESCINLHLKTVETLIQEGKLKYPENVVHELRKSFYVDNCVTSLDSRKEAEVFISLSSQIMMERQFELRGWEVTSEDMHINYCPPTNVLGILWNRQDDTLSISLDSLLVMDIEKITKRTILSAAHRLFDPIGVICSVTLLPKLLLQQTWAFGLSWDEEVPIDIENKFCDWIRDIKYLAEVEVPRWVVGINNSNSQKTLHVFADACQFAYAAAVFLRTETYGAVNVQLLAAKTRVAPMSKQSKKMTIPRLELMAACIAARLYATVKEDYEFHDVHTTFWTDASTVLAWIQRSEPWNSFVFNRIKEIRELTTGHEWRHIPGNENPADLPSRGCSAKKLLQIRWWEGPNWLKQPCHKWPLSDVSFNEIEVNVERKKAIVSSMFCQVDDYGWYFRYFSQFTKLVRMIGWIYRFKVNANIKKHDRIYQDLTASEYAAAERKVINLIQEDAFKDVFDSKLASLLPFTDGEGIIRLMTKVSNKDDANEYCHPAVLPGADHPVVHRLILNIHKNNCHAGTQMVMSILRQQYWILGGRQTIRTVLNSCTICKRHTTKKRDVEPSPLPETRVRNAKVFEVTGVDLAGPLYIKANGGATKFWICIFTCGVYRAVHLELVSSQSTDSFLQAFRRFASRRGRPKIIYSDHGTNFIGTDNAFKKLDWDAINRYSSIRKIEWRFNPPAAPWWGGWWERLIGILKTLLRKVLGKSSVSYEEMITILCDCESVINARPLTYISQDVNDLIVLTPSMFLQDVEEVGVPDFDLIEASDLNKRLRYRHKLKQTLRDRFRNEYLGQLKLLSSNKKTHNLSLGEIVLVGNDDTKRIDWPLARIVELIPGNDGNIRVVRVKTAHGELVRPAQRIYPLELHLDPSEAEGGIADYIREATAADLEVPSVHDEQEPSTVEGGPVCLSDDQHTQISKHGRLIQKPKKLNL